MPEYCDERDKFGKKIIDELKVKLLKLKDELDSKGHQVKLIAIIGSFARGDWKKSSDIDILLVCENISGPYWKRLDLPPILIQGHAVEYHIYSPQEIKILAEDSRMIIYDFFHSGIIIYADNDFLAEIRDIFRNALQRLKVIRRGNIIIREIE